MTRLGFLLRGAVSRAKNNPEETSTYKTRAQRPRKTSRGLSRTRHFPARGQQRGAAASTRKSGQFRSRGPWPPGEFTAGSFGRYSHWFLPRALHRRGSLEIRLCHAGSKETLKSPRHYLARKLRKGSGIPFLLPGKRRAENKLTCAYLCPHGPPTSRSLKPPLTCVVPVSAQSCYRWASRHLVVGRSGERVSGLPAA